MTDLGLELRLRALYNAEATSAPDKLRDRVLEIPAATAAPRVVLSERSRMVALLAAAVLLAALMVSGGVLAASGRLPLPWLPRPAFADPASLDACAVIKAGAARIHLTDSPFHAWRFDHGGELTTWGARVCAYAYDGGWNNPHLLLVPASTSLTQAEVLLGSIFAAPDDEAWRVGGWVRLAAGEWMASGVDRGSEFQVLAVSADPYFFVLTGSPAGTSDLQALAMAVLAELGYPTPGR